jgi:hypothetical protein
MTLMQTMQAMRPMMRPCLISISQEAMASQEAKNCRCQYLLLLFNKIVDINIVILELLILR